MVKKYLSLVLVALLAHAVSAAPALAESKVEKDVKLAWKVKQGVANLGIGRDARVTVKLRDKTKLTGYISEVKDESFMVTDLKTGVATDVAYPDVTQVKGNNLSTGAKIAIGAAIVGAIILLIFIGAYCNNEDC
jgi:hypothetical protein